MRMKIGGYNLIPSHTKQLVTTLYLLSLKCMVVKLFMQMGIRPMWYWESGQYCIRNQTSIILGMRPVIILGMRHGIVLGMRPV